MRGYSKMLKRSTTEAKKKRRNMEVLNSWESELSIIYFGSSSLYYREMEHNKQTLAIKPEGAIRIGADGPLSYVLRRTRTNSFPRVAAQGKANI